MRYQNYKNSWNYIWLGILVFLMFGGFKVLPSLVAAIAQFFPLILLFFLFRSMTRNSRIGSYLRQETMDHNRFVELLVHVLVHGIKADGKVDEREVRVIENFFRSTILYQGIKIEWVNDLIQSSIKQTPPLDELCAEFNSQFNYDAKLILLQLVYRVAMSDDMLAKSEKDFIESIVRLLGINASDHDRIRAFYKADQTADSYFEVLGVKPGASKEEVKKAYRDACKQHHPDKVHHLGEEFRKVAEEKMQKINSSYAALMKQYD